jgi:transcriptional regulator with XRE-family HTH domain
MVKIDDPRAAGKADKDLAQRIRLRRVELMISQAELAAKLGVSFQQIQKYEKGANRVGAARLSQIAETLGVPVSFFYESGQNNAKQGEVESLLFMDASFSLRLLRAYRSIKDVRLRRRFVTLAEALAGIEANDDDK